MYNTISEKICKVAYDLIAKVSPGLDASDIKILKESGPKHIKAVKKNVEKEKDALKGFSDDDRKTLLAYVVYMRQNATTGTSDKPNFEDTARILHGEVYKGDDKTVKEKRDKELLKQLGKAGINTGKDS